MRRYKMNDNRIYFYDNMKFILIIFVVMGHLFDNYVTFSNLSKSIYVFIYSFHMPLFIFISGLFHKHERITEKVVSFIVIGFVMKMIFFLEKLILFDQNPTFTLLSDFDVPWYMFVLAFYILITYLLRNIDKKFILYSSLLLSIFVGYDNSINDFLYLSRSIVFYPFYILGQIIKKEDVLALNQNKSLKICGFIIFLAWFFLCVWDVDQIYLLRSLFTGKNPYSIQSVFVKYGFLYRMLCYMISIIIGLSLICIIPKRKIFIISEYGKRTFQIYFWHQIIILFLVWMHLENVVDIPVIGKIILLILSLCISLILGMKIFSFPTKQLLQYTRNSLNINTSKNHEIF